MCWRIWILQCKVLLAGVSKAVRASSSRDVSIDAQPSYTSSGAEKYMISIQYDCLGLAALGSSSPHAQIAVGVASLQELPNLTQALAQQSLLIHQHSVSHPNQSRSKANLTTRKLSGRQHDALSPPLVHPIDKSLTRLPHHMMKLAYLLKQVLSCSMCSSAARGEVCASL